MKKPLKHDDIISSWESFLKGSPARFIRIKNVNKNTFVLERGKESPTMFFAVDVFKNNDSASDWFDNLIVKYQLKTIEVFFRKKKGGNGTVSEPNFNDTVYDVSSRYNVLKENNHTPMEKITPVSQKRQIPDLAPVPDLTPSAPGIPNTPTSLPFAPFQTAIESYSPPASFGLGAATMSAMGGLGQAALAAGMGLPELIEVKKKADRADEYKERLTKAEEDNHGLVMKNRELESKVSIAEQSKEMAVLAAKLDKKGIFDSEGVQKLIEIAPGLLQAMQSNNAQPTDQGLSVPSSLSASKQRLVGYLEDQSITDAMAPILELTMFLLSTNPNYATKLTQLNNSEEDVTTTTGNG